MIKLIFLAGKDMMNFRIEGRNIYYSDKVWKNEIRCIPKDEEFVKKIIMSRNKLPKNLIKMFTLSEREQKEYDDAKTDEELAENIIRDCKLKGLVLIKREDIK